MGAYRDNQGTWHYRKRITLADGTGTRIKGTPAINTKLEAERAERAHVERILRGGSEQLEPSAPAEVRREEEPLTLSKFVETIWWPKYSAGGGRRGVNSPTTLMEKDMHLRVHILPALGQLPLGDISNEAMTGFFGTLREGGYGRKGRRPTSTEKKAVQKRLERERGRKDRGKPKKGLAEKSVKNIRTTLRTILGFAVKWGYLDRMPEIPDVVVPEPSFDWYRPGEVRRLLVAARDEWARVVLLFAVHTGVRMGEQRALRWADVDFETRIISIRRSAPKWLVVEKSPKSNRHRRVDLTAELGEALEKIRHGGELVFCNTDGSKLRPGQFHEILWAAQRKGGLRRIKWHELRHSFASILTTGGAPLRIVQSLLGHSTIRMTERYAHLAPGESAGYMHLLATQPAPTASSAGPASGPARPKSDPN
jgi:integrase